MASLPLIKSVIYILRIIYNTPKSIQASVTILENLHLIIEKTKPEDVTTDIMPMLFYSFDGSTIQVQVSAPLGYANHSRRRRMEMEMRTGMGWRS